MTSALSCFVATNSRISAREVAQLENVPHAYSSAGRVRGMKDREDMIRFGFELASQVVASMSEPVLLQEGGDEEQCHQRKHNHDEYSVLGKKGNRLEGFPKVAGLCVLPRSE